MYKIFSTNLENLDNIQCWPERIPFLKKGTKTVTTPYSVPFLSVLHQNNFA